MRSILQRSSQLLDREADLVPSTDVSILGIDIDAVSTDSLGITAVLLPVFLGLRDQVLRLIVQIPADPVQEGKANTLGDQQDRLLSVQLADHEKLSPSMHH